MAREYKDSGIAQKQTNMEHIAESGMTALVQDVQKIIETARSNAVRSVDFCRVQMYWNLGSIFEEEQQGKERAGYGVLSYQEPGKTVRA